MASRIFLRVLLRDGRRVMVRDPDGWTDLQVEMGERIYMDVPVEERAGLQEQVAAVQVVADDGEHTVLAEFDSLDCWLRRGRGVHRTPLWLPRWLVASVDARIKAALGCKTLQGALIEILTAALREWVCGRGPVRPVLHLRLHAGGRIFVVPREPGEPWEHIQEEVTPGYYRDISAEECWADPIHLAGVVEQIDVVAATPGGAVVLGEFSPEAWRFHSGKRVVTPRLPRWLVWRLDDIKRKGGGPRRRIVEAWLIAELVRRGLFPR